MESDISKNRYNQLSHSGNYIYNLSTPDWLYTCYDDSIRRGLKSIVSKIPTPINVIIGGQFSSQLAYLKEIFDPTIFEIRFGGKAWFHPQFIRELTRLDTAICAGSKNEVDMAIAGGMSESKIYFMQPGIHPNDLEDVISSGVNIYIDSEMQANFCAKLPVNRRPSNVGLRIATPNVAVKSEAIILHDDNYRLGIPENQLMKVYKTLKDAGIVINEVLGHIGSIVISPMAYVKLLERLSSILKELPDVKLINLGGGLPFGYIDETDAIALSTFAKELILKKRQLEKNFKRAINIALEPARNLVAPSAIQIVTITDIKTTPTNKKIIFCDANFATLEIDWPISLLSDFPPVKWGRCELAGNLCSPSHTITTKMWADVQIGMHLAIGAIGAYAVPLAPASLQNLNRASEVVLQDNGRWNISRIPLNNEERFKCVP